MVRWLIVVAVLSAADPGVAMAQERPVAASNADALRVFLDCSPCDFTFLRQNIDWINWVREREGAQVHLLITIRRSDASFEYTLEFIGRETFAGLNQILHHTSSVTDTTDERRRSLARVIRVGLARYAVETSGGGALDVQPQIARRRGVARPEDDRWNFWIFSLGMNGSYSGESRQRFLSLAPSAAANRTTADWKISIRAEETYSNSTFEFGDGTSFEDVTRDVDVGFQMVKTLGDHWGGGVGGDFQRSTFYNLNPSYRAAAALEYNVFPYAESSRRAWTFAYFTGATRFNYEEATIFNVVHETLVNHGGLMKLDLKSPWGSSSVDVVAHQFVREPSQYSLTTSGSVNYRVVRGLGIFISGDYSLVRNQRYLAKRGASDEEVLVRRRALATSSSVFVSLGLTYTFGSIFNSTVNTRLTGASGRFDQIF